MTALFVVMFVDQWEDAQDHKPALVGIVCSVICLVIFGALMFSMLLAWTPKSSNMVQGVQGRYMLPLLPVFLFTLKNQKVIRTGTDDRLILYTMMAADVYVILRIFAVVCLRL